MLKRFISSTSRSISSRDTLRPFTGEASWRFTPLNFTARPLIHTAPDGRTSTFLRPSLQVRMSSPAVTTSV